MEFNLLKELGFSGSDPKAFFTEIENKRKILEARWAEAHSTAEIWKKNHERNLRV
ncbi:MAG: hypothetical protein WCY93_12060 [Anaerolineaceae bacterium]